MSGNTIGKVFCVTSFGESHGPAIGCVVDGCPPGMELSSGDIQQELDRRKPGTSRYVTQRKESDTVEILSGVFEGKTTGTPLGLLIRNEDQRSKDYSKIMEAFRPGHADYTYWQKYGIRDYRGGGRASARETAVRVAAASVAKKWLYEKFGISIRGYMAQLGPVEVPFKQWDTVNSNPFFSANSDMVPQLEEFMEKLRKSGDSVGAKIIVVAENVPVGWGEPVYDRLDADIAHAMMSINAVKGIEIGAGFASVAQKGTQHSDEITSDGFLSNNAGGILGGISTGQDIIVNIAIKPTSSIRLERRSIDKSGKPVIVETHGRHDPCVGIRATPIAEAMLALVLMDHALRHRAQNADVKCSTPKISGKTSREESVLSSGSIDKPEPTENPEPDEA
ncbi:MAG: chorismate synthase [Nitrosomonadaceae bacterium]